MHLKHKVVIPLPKDWDDKGRLMIVQLLTQWFDEKGYKWSHSHNPFEVELYCEETCVIIPYPKGGCHEIQLTLIRGLRSEGEWDWISIEIADPEFFSKLDGVIQNHKARFVSDCAPPL